MPYLVGEPWFLWPNVVHIHTHTESVNVIQVFYSLILLEDIGAFWEITGTPLWDL